MQNKMTFGSVTVELNAPSETEIKKNVKEGKVVISRLLEQIQTPGVKITFKKDVPYYRADPEKPSRLIRKLNGKEEPVVLKNGKFVVCE